MEFNKDIFAIHFKNKDYDFCSEMLRDEIIRILVDKIREVKPDYKYTTISFLKNDCFNFLDSLYQDVAVRLYAFSFNDDVSEFELSSMFEIYQDLIRK